MSDLLKSASVFRVYADPTAAAAGVAVELAVSNRKMVSVRCQAAGNLLLTPAGGGTAETVPFLAGETQRLCASAVTAAGSGAVGPITIGYT